MRHSYFQTHPRRCVCIYINSSFPCSIVVWHYMARMPRYLFIQLLTNGTQRLFPAWGCSSLSCIGWGRGPLRGSPERCDPSATCGNWLSMNQQAGSYQILTLPGPYSWTSQALELWGINVYSFSHPVSSIGSQPPKRTKTMAQRSDGVCMGCWAQRRGTGCFYGLEKTNSLLSHFILIIKQNGK